MHFLCHCCTSIARSNIKCIVKPLKNESSIAALTNDSINFVCPLEWTRLSYVHFFVFYVALAARWAIEYWKRSAKNQQNTGQQCFSFVRDRIRLLSFESSFFPTTTANAIMHRIVKVKFWVRLHSAALCEERKQKKKKMCALCKCHGKRNCSVEPQTKKNIRLVFSFMCSLMFVLYIFFVRLYLASVYSWLQTTFRCWLFSLVFFPSGFHLFLCVTTSRAQWGIVCIAA